MMIDNSKLPSMSTYKIKNSNNEVEQNRRIPEPRVVTLSPQSLRLISSLGIMEIAEKSFITNFYDMIVYEQVGRSFMRFNNILHKKNSQLVNI